MAAAMGGGATGTRALVLRGGRQTIVKMAVTRFYGVIRFVNCDVLFALMNFSHVLSPGGFCRQVALNRAYARAG
jgi:hypothetical protein